MSKGIIEHSRNLNSNISDIIIYNNFKKRGNKMSQMF